MTQKTANLANAVFKWFGIVSSTVGFLWLCFAFVARVDAIKLESSETKKAHEDLKIYVNSNMVELKVTTAKIGQSVDDIKETQKSILHSLDRLKK